MFPQFTVPVPRLYVIGMLEDAIKIGITRGTLEARCAVLQCGNPMRLDPLAEQLTDHPAQLERAWHARLWRYRAEGEWFIVPPRVRSCIVSMVRRGKAPRAVGQAKRKCPTRVAAPPRI